MIFFQWFWYKILTQGWNISDFKPSIVVPYRDLIPCLMILFLFLNVGEKHLQQQKTNKQEEKEIPTLSIPKCSTGSAAADDDRVHGWLSL